MVPSSTACYFDNRACCVGKSLAIEIRRSNENVSRFVGFANALKNVRQIPALELCILWIHFFNPLLTIEGNDYVEVTDKFMVSIVF